MAEHRRQTRNDTIHSFYTVAALPDTIIATLGRHRTISSRSHHSARGNGGPTTESGSREWVTVAMHREFIWSTSLANTPLCSESPQRRLKLDGAALISPASHGLITSCEQAVRCHELASETPRRCRDCDFPC
jgi:hypothetical protein